MSDRTANEVWHGIPRVDGPLYRSVPEGEVLCSACADELVPLGEKFCRPCGQIDIDLEARRLVADASRREKGQAPVQPRIDVGVVEYRFSRRELWQMAGLALVVLGGLGMALWRLGWFGR